MTCHLNYNRQEAALNTMCFLIRTEKMIKGKISLYLFVLGKWHQHFFNIQKVEEGEIHTMLSTACRKENETY